MINPKVFEKLKIVLLCTLFVSMLILFWFYAGMKLGEDGAVGISGKKISFPTDRMWIFSSNTSQSLTSQTSVSYFMPSSITFKINTQSFSTLRQKSAVYNVYSDITPYIAEVLGEKYSCTTVDKDKYYYNLKNNNCILITYDNDIPVYVLKLFCDRKTVNFFEGKAGYIKKMLFTNDADGLLCAYAVNSEDDVMYFSLLPNEKYDGIKSPINSTLITAYTDNKTLVECTISYNDDYFSNPDLNFSSDIVLQKTMQFFELGVLNPLDYVNILINHENKTAGTIMKNKSMLAILKSFKINTGIVKYYTDNGIINFVDKGATLEISSTGTMMYNGESGGINLSKFLNTDTQIYTFADKLSAACAFIGGFDKDIIGGTGDLYISSVTYDKKMDILRFEFSYYYDTVPFYNFEKAVVEINKNSIVKAYIPTYSFYQQSTHKKNVVSPIVSFAMLKEHANNIDDYKIAYIANEGKTTAGVGWVAVTGGAQ